jgi:hypothetical protein
MMNKIKGGVNKALLAKVLLTALFAIRYSLFTASAQVGEYRTDLAVGFNGGYTMSSIAFVPKVPQGQLGGLTAGFSARYTCEKYFKSICAVVGEVNLAQIGWQENILDINDQPVPLHTDETQTLRYARKMSYVQVPVFARLGWGRERKGFQGFFQVGPQLGFFLSEKTDANFDVHDPAFNPDVKDGYYSAQYKYAESRVSDVVAQDTMAVENTFDYGIAAGAGLEFSHPKLGHFLLEGRYYYGLGNIYGSSKRDYFARSNFGNIVIKFTYLFDIIRTKDSKIK